MKTKTILLGLIIGLFSISFSTALNANFTVTGNSNNFINLASNNTINITIGAVEGNITNLTFTYTVATGQSPADLYINRSNGSSLADTFFADRTAYPGGVSRNYNFTFNNASGGTLVVNGTTKNFWIGVLGRGMATGPGALLSLTVNASNASGYGNVTTINFSASFTFIGYVVNETGCSTCWQNGTNVTIYGTTWGQNSPPTSTLLASALTNASGFFRLNLVNASPSFNGFRLKMIFYNSTGRATKTGMVMPEFPSFMYYGGGFGDEGFDMTLNGATFYLQGAHTINLSAHNSTYPVSFGYEVIDQALGFPIESKSLVKINNDELVLPSGRGYTISFFRMFSFPGSSFGYLNNWTYCGTGDFMNDTFCPAPPKTYSIPAANTTIGNITMINQSLIIRKVNIMGCLTPANGANNSAINITSINVKMLPWTTDAGSFIPSTSGDDGSINITANINYTNTASGCAYAFYNLSLLNQTSYMIEFYAKNGTDESNNPGSANHLAAFMNFTTTDGLMLNRTLYKLLGTLRWSNDTRLALNTSVIKINVINSSGGAVTTTFSANLKIRNTAAGLGTVFYMIDSQNMINGSFYVPVLNSSSYAKIMIFSQNGPPKELSLNLSSSVINVTIASMGMDKGFRKFNSTGGLDTVNTNSMPISMRFLRNTAECGVANAPSSCVITEMNASSFNPLKAMLAGKVNMEIKMTSTNVSIIFNDYDMISAKQPPMESIMDENASARGTTSGSAQVRDSWNFGSFAPVDSYTNVTIIIPYSDISTASGYLNDSAQVNFSIPALYNENNAVTWNKTAGSDYHNLTDDFVKYNSTYYRGLLNTSGVICSSAGFNETCFVNTTANYMAIHVPHFSTIGGLVTGSATTAADSSSSSSSGGGGGGGGTSVYTITEAQLTSGYTQTMNAGSSIKMNISGAIHQVILSGVRNRTSATITVLSTPQVKVFNERESQNFDVTSDGVSDIKVTLNSVNFTIGEAKITVIKFTTTSPTNTAPATTPTTSLGQGTAETASLGEEKTISTTTWWTIAVIAVVIILFVLIAIIITRYQKYQEKLISKKVRVYGNIAK